MISQGLPARSTERIALLLQYSGTNYCGWQVQPSLRTVQGELEQAIQAVTGDRTRVTCAGRTDSGVHALFQVVHFDAVSQFPFERWSQILNARLPDDISVLVSTRVPCDWHARFSALWRRYRYIVRLDGNSNALASQRSWNRRIRSIDVESMRVALATMLGRHSFRALHRSGSNRLDSWVNIQDVSCFCNGLFVIFEIQADGFLYGMVRLLVGLLVQVGEGVKGLDEFSDIVFGGRRDCVRHAAPACGLYLCRVGYGESSIGKFYDVESGLLLRMFL